MFYNSRLIKIKIELPWQQSIETKILIHIKCQYKVNNNESNIEVTL